MIEEIIESFNGGNIGSCKYKAGERTSIKDEYFFEEGLLNIRLNLPIILSSNLEGSEFDIHNYCYHINNCTVLISGDVRGNGRIQIFNEDIKEREKALKKLEGML